MIKRILMLGLAAVALALVAPAIGAEGGLGGNVAHAQTDPAAPDQPETPDAPDQSDTPEAPDQPAAPEAPDQPAAPEAPDQPAAPEGDDQGDNNTGDESQCAADSRAGAHASGEDCPPVTQTPAPAPRLESQPQKKHHKQESGGGSGSVGESAQPVVTPQVVTRPAANVASSVDTGTIPQGGIQAGAGGTADDGSASALLPGGALMLALAAGGLALRRRHGLES
jgi:hypothetical protein